MGQNNCKICGNCETQFLIEVESKRYAPGEHFKLYRCRKCEGVYINPYLTFDEIQKYYPAGYEPHDPKRLQPVNTREIIMKSLRHYVYGCQPGSGAQNFSVAQYILSAIFDRLTYRSFPRPGGGRKLLDVGCGSGAYLAMARELGWRTYGVESNPAAAQHALKTLDLEVQTGDFGEASYPEKHFDVITMWHSLEHFSDPLQIIRKVRALLKDDGMLMIGVPNFASLDRNLFRESWNGLEIPLHAWHFTPASLQYLLKESGFEKIKILHTTRPTDMAKSFNCFLEDRYRLKPFKLLSMCLLLLSIPASMCFSMCRRSSIIKVYAS